MAQIAGEIPSVSGPPWFTSLLSWIRNCHNYCTMQKKQLAGKHINTTIPSFPRKIPTATSCRASACADPKILASAPCFPTRFGEWCPSLMLNTPHMEGTGAPGVFYFKILLGILFRYSALQQKTRATNHQPPTTNLQEAVRDLLLKAGARKSPPMHTQGLQFI